MRLRIVGPARMRPIAPGIYEARTPDGSTSVRVPVPNPYLTPKGQEIVASIHGLALLIEKIAAEYRR